MKNITSIKILAVFLFVAVTTGFCLTTWKMFEFRHRLHEYIDNEKWYSSLCSCPIANNNSIVFFGDSQIALWPMAPSFGSLPIINKGICGDWALTAINRLESDVLSLNPKILVVLIGTNDLGSGRENQQVLNNIIEIVKKASDHNIKVMLCSLLPVRNEYTANHPLQDILQINNSLKSISMNYNAEYVDFYSALVNNNNLFDTRFTSDGLHPNKTGYLIMARTIFPHLAKYYYLCI